MTTEAWSLRHGAMVRQKRRDAARRRVEWLKQLAKHEESIRQWQWQWEREASPSAIAMHAEVQDEEKQRRIGFVGLLRRLFD